MVHKMMRHRLENESAKLLSQNGYEVIHLPEPTSGSGFGIQEKSNPDYLINGNPFDAYAPTTDKIQGIFDAINDKTKNQAVRIIVNLDRNDHFSIQSLKNSLNARKIPNAKEIIAIKDGVIEKVFDK